MDEAAATSIDEVFRRYEIQAVESAPATVGALALLRRGHGRGQVVSIVSNNSAAAVGHYLERHAVGAVSARQDAVVGRLKPSPYLLEQAMCAADTPPPACLMIGDSATDIEAARAAGTGVVALANKPGKREMFAALRPDAIIMAMTQL